MIAALRTSTLRPYGVTIPAIAAVGAYMAFLSWAVENSGYDTWGGVLVATAVLLASLPVVRYLARREADPRVARLLPWALALKLGASLIRLAITFGVYDGVADATTYHSAGQLLAPLYRRGDFSADIGPLVGTGFVKALTGVVYAVIGATRLGGFVVFSWFGFWGLYLFYRAFCVACPEGDQWRYARLVFLLPSLLFWPSSIGKEAWMTLALGMATYGAARILTRARGGFAALAAGGLAMMAVRPHVAIILVVSLVPAYLFRRPPAGGSILGPVAKIGGILLLGVILAVAVGEASELFGLQDRFDAEAVSQVLERANEQTAVAGSAFGTGSTDFSPSAFPRELMSVLFRPYPWEAGNALAFAASIEGTFLLGLMVVCRGRLVGAVRSILRTPYVVLCLVYAVLFIYGFSSFANFGVLTRQRVQVFPYLLVLLALPSHRHTDGGWRDLFTRPYDDVPGEADGERSLASTSPPR
ncbi:MAG TPA: hypothetical protein VHM89_02950 [Acidimicrobiales bacterium]|nr:hypothetical protein [Acidimicrobiales bacterium]